MVRWAGFGKLSLMAALTRILLLEASDEEWQSALMGFADAGLLEQAAVVKDKSEALDFLLAKGAFRNRAPGYPAVVVVGPNGTSKGANATVREIRSYPALRKIPLVVIAAERDPDFIRNLYVEGVNSVVIRRNHASALPRMYGALGRFWAQANEPPPGCIG